MNGCVRDATNEKKVKHLQEMVRGASTTTGRLTLFSTGNLGENINFESSSLFDDAIRDCDAIIHDDDVLAEPTKFDHTRMNTLNVNCRNAKEMLRDAIEDLKSKGHL